MFFITFRVITIHLLSLIKANI